MDKTILYNEAARTKLKAGVDKLANAVKVTLGAKGRHVIIGPMHGTPHATKDGVSVARAVQLADPVENTGANIVYQAAHMTAYEAGDGTTTSTVLAQALIELGMEAIAQGINPVHIKAGYELALQLAIQAIKEQAQPISTGDEVSHLNVGHIATIAANGNRELGDMIAEAVRLIGKDGLITIGDTINHETSISIVKGLRIDKGYLNWHFITNAAKQTCELQNPVVLLYEKKISRASDLMAAGGVLEQVYKAGESILIMAEDIEGEALASLMASKAKSGLKVCCVKLPAAGDARKELLEDIAASTGATITGPERSIKLTEIKIEMLGRADNISIGKDETVIYSNKARSEAIEERAQQLRAQIAELGEIESSAQARTNLQERIGRLTGGVALIHVGGSTEIEIKANRDLVDDAIRATQSALQEGIVCGGGVALVRVANQLRDKLLNDPIIKTLPSPAIQCFKSFEMVLSAPIRQILTNAGEEDINGIVQRVYSKGIGSNEGYNALTGNFEDLMAAGVIDAAKVTRCALQNATSVACVLLTSECAIVDSMPA